MQLYTFSKAPNPKRLGYFLSLKGIDIPTKQIDLNQAEQFSESFKAINPSCTLPTLVLDDGTVLTDTVAICVYLESKYPEKPLFGRNKEEYAEVIGWTHRLYLEGLTPIAEVLRNQSDFFKDRALPGALNVPQIPDLIERGNIRLDAFWSNMNKHLLERQYIVGDQLTMADIDCFAVCNFANWIKKQIPEECASFRLWHERVEKLLNE